MPTYIQPDQVLQMRKIQNTQIAEVRLDLDEGVGLVIVPLAALQNLSVADRAQRLCDAVNRRIDQAGERRVMTQLTGAHGLELTESELGADTVS